VKDRSQKAFSRRRVLNFGTLSAASLVALGLTRLPRHTAFGLAEKSAEAVDAKPTVIAFIGALFGRTLSQPEAADLAFRLDYNFSRDPTFRTDCAFLARYLDRTAREAGAASFDACHEAQKDAMVDTLMQIDPRSAIARILARSAQSERDYYGMRGSTVGRLAWIYRHSSAAWLNRGYRRWPGIGGDWHEVLRPGAGYP
jgi:hypothetical protein